MFFLELTNYESETVSVYGEIILTSGIFCVRMINGFDITSCTSVRNTINTRAQYIFFLHECLVYYNASTQKKLTF